MNSKFTADFNKPTIITAQQYGTKISVEIDHSDTDIDELFDAFQTLVVGLGYHDSAWKEWIIDRANEYIEDDKDTALARGDMGMYEPSPELKKAVEDYIANRPKVNEEEEDDFFGKWNDKRMDIIGQNGNEGLHYEDDKYTTKCYCGHTNKCDCGPEDDYNATLDQDEERYRATDEDEAEFDDYGARIPGKKITFEWGDDPEDDDLFEGDEWKPNENLKAANERYKKEVKKMNIKKRKPKSVKDWENDYDLGGNE